ncbi:MAG: LysM peptidoglycan-binding domain-containing protein [Planctomycetia bacterium]|nr:LysM peptidoglycan-binding domain-containing protein [Planctomycetia bacterium]
MGREKRFLLTLLGLLCGVFLGVLSMKLLVPRPPAGAGPDVEPHEAVAARQEIVEPPALDRRPTGPAAAEPAAPAVVQVAFEEAVVGIPEGADPGLPSPGAIDPPPAASTARPAAAPVAGSHVAEAGDTWWSIAERAYGDGRLYRALFAWNRRLDPRVSMVAGTRLEIPPRASLTAALPALAP